MGIKLNVSEVLRKETIRKNTPRSLPQATFKNGTAKSSLKTSGQPIVYQKALATPSLPDQTTPLLRDLWDKITVVKKRRAKLSTQTAHLVDQLAARLRMKDGPAVADEFLNGNIPDPEIVKHYASIQAFTDEAVGLYDKIKYVEKYGQLPRELEASSIVAVDGPDISMLQIELIRLKDLIHKTKKKIAAGMAKNPLRITEWHEKLALAEARREDVRLRIKKLQYDARGKRAGE